MTVPNPGGNEVEAYTHCTRGHSTDLSTTSRPFVAFRDFRPVQHSSGKL